MKRRDWGVSKGHIPLKAGQLGQHKVIKRLNP